LQPETPTPIRRFGLRVDSGHFQLVSLNSEEPSVTDRRTEPRRARLELPARRPGAVPAGASFAAGARPARRPGSATTAW
jgi:hypothetical protein